MDQPLMNYNCDANECQTMPGNSAVPRRAVAAVSLSLLVGSLISLTLPKLQNFSAEPGNSLLQMKTPRQQVSSSTSVQRIAIVPHVPLGPHNWPLKQISNNPNPEQLMLQTGTTPFVTPAAIAAFTTAFLVTMLGVLFRVMKYQSIADTRAHETLSYGMLNVSGDADDAGEQSTSSQAPTLQLKRPAWRAPPAAQEVDALQTASPVFPRPTRPVEVARKIIDLHLDLPPVASPLSEPTPAEPIAQVPVEEVAPTPVNIAEVPPVVTNEAPPAVTSEALPAAHEIPSPPAAEHVESTQSPAGRLDGVSALKRPVLRRPTPPAAKPEVNDIAAGNISNFTPQLDGAAAQGSLASGEQTDPNAQQSVSNASEPEVASSAPSEALAAERREYEESMQKMMDEQKKMTEAAEEVGAQTPPTSSSATSAAGAGSSVSGLNNLPRPKISFQPPPVRSEAKPLKPRMFSDRPVPPPIRPDLGIQSLTPLAEQPAPTAADPTLPEAIQAPVEASSVTEVKAEAVAAPVQAEAPEAPVEASSVTEVKAEAVAAPVQAEAPEVQAATDAPTDTPAPVIPLASDVSLDPPPASAPTAPSLSLLQRPTLARPKPKPIVPRMVINLDDIPDRSAPVAPAPPREKAASPKEGGKGGKGRNQKGGRGKGGRGQAEVKSSSPTTEEKPKSGVTEKPKTVEQPTPKFGADSPKGGRGKGGKGSRKKDEEVDKSDILLLKARKKNRMTKRERRSEEQLANAAQKEEIIEVMPEGMLVSELAEKLAISPANVVTVLFKKGIMSAPNQMISFDLVKIVCDEYEVEVLQAEEKDGIASIEDRFVLDEEDHTLVPRPPVVTIMGHVDHGKTSLLDYIRKSNIAAGEASGITQAIGAYHVEMPSPTGGEPQRISFIDTPGHEAFTAMRARGATVTDITIIVVAADDGVRPQTKEAIAHCRAAGVPMVVAINKIDKDGADPQRVATELAQEGLVSEEWGGDTPMVNISAKKGIGIQELLEMVLLSAELADLKANPDACAEGTVIEAHLDRNRGPIATVLVQNGTLRIGDIMVCNGTWGKVRALLDEHGESVEEVPPSLPAQVLGLDDVPSAGDRFMVYLSEKEAKEKADEYNQDKKEKNWAALAARDLVRSDTNVDGKGLEVLNVILKTDVAGSCEAIKSALNTLPQQKIELRLIMAASGDITVSDVNLAASTGSIIVGFNVGTFPAAAAMIKNLAIKCMVFDVIYDLIDEVKAVMEGRLGDEQIRERCGEAEVKAVFAARDGKKAAGCLVVDGRLAKPGYVEVMRKKKIVFAGELEQLRRMKDQVKEVAADTECGVTVNEWDEWEEGDRIICYTLITRQRALEVAA